MASVSSLGVGSGIDLQSLVDGLVAAETQLRLGSLDQRAAAATERISAYGLLKSSVSLFDDALTSLSDISTFRARNASSSNEDAFSVSAADDAGLGTYTVEVVSAGAAQTLTGENLLDVTGSAITSANTAIGGGTLTIRQGTQPSFAVEISSVASSLNDIATAINNASGNTGVQATVINADSGPVLVLNTADVGTDNEITISVDDIDGDDTNTLGLSQLTFDPLDIPGSNLGQLTAAVDAQITLNGLTVTSDSGNVFADVVSGVTITALAETTEAETATINKDSQKAVDAVNQFVDSFNELASSIDELGQAGEDGVGGGILVGDSVLRSLSGQLRRTIFTAVDQTQPEGVQTLSDIGISITREGTLSLDSVRFDELLESNFDDVARLLSADGNPIAQNNAFRSVSFATPATAIGEGTLSITVGEDSFDVSILAASNTLTDIRDAINNAVDNAGVSAAIVLVDDGGGGTEAQLLLTAEQTGETVSVAVDDDDGNDTDLAGLSQLASGNLVELVSSELDAPEGIILRLQTVLDGFLGGSGETGIIDTRTEGLNADIDRIEDERLDQERRLENFQDRLVSQFAALDLLVANLSSSGDFLLSQLNAASSISLNQNSSS